MTKTTKPRIYWGIEDKIKLDEDFVDNVPAINRQEKCMSCGKEFYKAWVLQSVCSECLKETQRELPEQEEQDRLENEGR